MSLRQTRYLLNRLVALGVSKSLASQIVREVSHHVSKSGPEWTVNRLKLLKTAFLRRVAGASYTLPYIASRKDRLGVVPKGPFGALWNTVDYTDITSVSRAVNAMMIYSDIIAPEVTPAQWEKFHKSATRAPSPSEDVVESLSIPDWMRVDRSIQLEQFEQFVVRKGYSPSFVNDALESFIESDSGMALWEEYPQYKESFGSIADDVDKRIGMDDYFGYHPSLKASSTEDPIGTLGCTQEPGYKLRVFANPNICHQLAMSRMKGQLFRLLRKAHWDCTYDQANGTAWAQRQLVQGKELYSIDLSDATNNFPLDLQLKVLQEIGCLNEDIKLFHQLSRMPWQATHDRRIKVRWTVGQPLGLAPSFAAFALTHGVLVHSIARACRVTDCFRVLGDDIVISDEQVATRYLEAMQKLGVPVSKDKTIVSYVLAEFAGKIVTRDGILAALKWRKPSDRSFIDVVRLLGPKAVALLTERQRRVISVLSVLPSPEGFGWNPKGLPLAKRLEVLQAYNDIIPDRTRTFYPMERQWMRIRLFLKQPYLQLPFKNVPQGSFWDIPTGKASELRSREPTPVGSWRHLLSISEMTGCPLKLPEREITPGVVKELTRRGFTSPPPSSDPRGSTPLEMFEARFAQLYRQYREHLQ